MTTTESLKHVINLCTSSVMSALSDCMQFACNADEWSSLLTLLCVVRMYKCSAMASTCGGCRRTDHVYHCGWDSTSSRCCAFNECAGPSWLSPDDICTNPSIFTVSYMETECRAGLLFTNFRNTLFFSLPSFVMTMRLMLLVASMYASSLL